MPESTGRLEGAVSEALVKFEKEYMGRGPHGNAHLHP